MKRVFLHYISLLTSPLTKAYVLLNLKELDGMKLIHKYLILKPFLSDQVTCQKPKFCFFFISSPSISFCAI